MTLVVADRERVFVVVPDYVGCRESLEPALERRLVSDRHVQLVGSTDQLRPDSDRQPRHDLGHAEPVAQPARVLPGQVPRRPTHQQPSLVADRQQIVDVRLCDLLAVEQPRDFRLRVADVAQSQSAVHALQSERIAEVAQELRRSLLLPLFKICLRVTETRLLTLCEVSDKI